jgi:lipoprotein-anchoring transpeptidase ErfK/SrfK
VREQLSRRDFLKFSSGALAAALTPSWKRWLPPAEQLAPQTVPQATAPIGRMGRAMGGGVAVYDKAERGAQRLASYRRDESFVVTGDVRAPGLNHYNDLWYETQDGFVFSAWVQPMLQYLPQPAYYDMGEWGLWGEICQPYTSARLAPHSGAAERYRKYYGTTYHIIGVQHDEEGNAWYQAFDELPPTTSYWVPAQDVRIIPRSELAPISPFVGDKRIEIDLGNQRVTCLENGQVVYSCGCASGAAFTIEDGSIADFSTPRGEYHVLLKQASRHMVGENEESPDYFDLPGVPWDTFFDLEGRAIHGTYWHNDYGVPRSHGCVNVSIDAARWIYCWTHPIGAYADDYIQSNWRVGTPIVIF